MATYALVCATNPSYCRMVHGKTPKEDVIRGLGQSSSFCIDHNERRKVRKRTTALEPQYVLPYWRWIHSWEASFIGCHCEKLFISPSIWCKTCRHMSGRTPTQKLVHTETFTDMQEYTQAWARLNTEKTAAALVLLWYCNWQDCKNILFLSSYCAVRVSKRS